ncbi:hypothetical protein NX059_005042 [Plenodomus lindquistii]|nr:hypothetical protein NX059_005042 [Plenodomus lindquistii]
MSRDQAWSAKARILENVIVTGANGYVAGQVLDELLKTGCTVRGTVRSKKVAAQVRKTFSSYLGSQLSLAIVKDFTDVDSFRGVIDSVTTGVIHIASPGAENAKDVVKDLLLPAIN